MPDASALRPDLSLVLERITDGFFALDAQWRITYINAQARKLLHAPPDCVGTFWLDIFPKARGRLFEREYQRAMRDQHPVQFVEYSATAELWLEVKAYPSPDGMSVYFRDVTSRIEAQREIERNARRQQALIEFGRSALAGATYDQMLGDAIDLVREVLEASAVDLFHYDRLTGTFSVNRSAGWDHRAAVDPHHPPLDHIAAVVRTGEPFVCSDVRVDPRARNLAQLEHCGVLSCVAALIGTPAAPLGAIASYHAHARTFSVGDVRFIEVLSQSLAEFSSALESNRLMSEVLESIGDAFVAIDGALRITYVNRRMANYWRKSAAEMIGVSILEYIRSFDTPDGRIEQFFREALREHRQLTFENQHQGRWHETRLYPFGSGVAGYVRDITARKTEQARILSLNADLERRVAERTNQLELANKELESFSYSVSHDLRAPLRAIDGFSAALLEDYGETLDGRARNHLDRVRRAAQRMADLIDALLKLAKVARTPIAFSPVDLSTMAATVAAELHESDPGHEVEVSIEPGLMAQGEPHLLRIALANLLGNAWKFTRNTQHAQVQVGKNSEGEFYVRDNGAGFDMTYANKLFGAFARLHSSDEYEGTGIGLATVARIIHRHGGGIHAEGAVGKGATFYFTLPGSP
ncbi:MAG TPA: PAS domain-containing protein [Candidatus Acidoferrales bacterium]|nr:PAS domain-containing protein [Candidatus Acidoferrales bacterium]